MQTKGRKFHTKMILREKLEKIYRLSESERLRIKAEWNGKLNCEEMISPDASVIISFVCLSTLNLTLNFLSKKASL